MDQNLFIEKFTTKLTRLGLTVPALLLLEAHKPLAFLGSQLLLVVQPSLNLFISPVYTQGIIDLLADPNQVEQCLSRLEQISKKDSPTLTCPNISHNNKETTL